MNVKYAHKLVEYEALCIIYAQKRQMIFVQAKKIQNNLKYFANKKVQLYYYGGGTQ